MKKTVIITGASSGIGRACALAFARPDYELVLNSRANRAALEEAADLVRKAGSPCITLPGDVSDDSFCRRLVQEAADVFHDPDILVNNAGISHIGLFQDMQPAEWDHLLRVNLCSVLSLCHAVIPAMVRRKSGRILNVSSVWGAAGASCEAVYSATKGAVNAFTRALAKELAPSGICVNAAAFGAIDTPMNADLGAGTKTLLSEEIPAGRLGTPEEAGRFLRMLAEAPAYFNGQVVTMDGAWI